MELLELIINDEDESGVDYIALVDEPAIESHWMAFDKQKTLNLEFQIQDEEKRIVSGYFMIADLPIIRVNEKGEKFYVLFRKDTINTIVNKFFKQGYSNNINIMHNKNNEADGVYVIESLIIDSKRGSYAPSNFEKVPDGSWWGSMRIENDALWKMVQDGEFNGFSVEGIFKHKEKNKDYPESIITKIREVIKNYNKK